MSVKPVLSKLGCRRLGTRANSQRPRKLLVHLESESTVADLLRDAKRLRLSEDAAVASSVYINPDWSPAERKLAYVQRQQRRSAKQTRVKTVLNTAVASTVESKSEAIPTRPVNIPFQPDDISYMFKLFIKCEEHCQQDMRIALHVVYW